LLKLQYPRIKSIIEKIRGREIYICGAMATGHAWHLHGYLHKTFSGKKFIFLQYKRDKESNEKGYEVWV
jgi:hypothetical protein